MIKISINKALYIVIVSDVFVVTRLRLVSFSITYCKLLPEKGNTNCKITILPLSLCSLNSSYMSVPFLEYMHGIVFSSTLSTPTSILASYKIKNCVFARRTKCFPLARILLKEVNLIRLIKIDYPSRFRNLPLK